MTMHRYRIDDAHYESFEQALGAAMWWMLTDKRAPDEVTVYFWEGRNRIQKDSWIPVAELTWVKPESGGQDTVQCTYLTMSRVDPLPDYMKSWGTGGTGE